MIARRREEYRAYRIAPGDTNRLVPVFDPSDGAKFLFAIEIFDVGGKTPPNVHVEAEEMFYVLHGEGTALCGDDLVPVRTGDSLLLKPGTMHVIENTGATRLYCLTLMVPNEGFAELIRSGAQAPIDDEDWAVLLGGRAPP
jgi:mannose-6-phosphate isomerase-like protein (cupin superfamily)